MLLPSHCTLRTGLDDFSIGVAHDAQQAGGIHHLRLDVSLFLEPDPHCWVIAASLQPTGLRLRCGGLGLQVPLTDGGHRPAQVARVEERALLPLVFVKDSGVRSPNVCPRAFHQRSRGSMTWESAEMILWKCRVATMGPPSRRMHCNVKVALRLSCYAGIRQPLFMGPLYCDLDALQTSIARMEGAVVMACAPGQRCQRPTSFSQVCCCPRTGVLAAWRRSAPSAAIVVDRPSLWRPGSTMGKPALGSPA